MDYSPPLCPLNSLGKNTGVGCHSHLQGIFPNQVSNPGLLHCRQILYHLSHQGSPYAQLEIVKKIYIQTNIWFSMQLCVLRRQHPGKQRVFRTGLCFSLWAWRYIWNITPLFLMRIQATALWWWPYRGIYCTLAVSTSWDYFQRLMENSDGRFSTFEFTSLPLGMQTVMCLETWWGSSRKGFLHSSLHRAVLRAFWHHWELALGTSVFPRITKKKNFRVGMGMFPAFGNNANLVSPLFLTSFFNS